MSWGGGANFTLHKLGCRSADTVLTGGLDEHFKYLYLWSSYTRLAASKETIVTKAIPSGFFSDFDLAASI